MASSKQIQRFFLVFILLLTGFSFSSCTRHIGYGVITWSKSEYSLTAGDIVPVFIQSNIGKVYVVGVGNGSRKHVELPLWQLTLYKSKSQAKKAAQVMSDYRYMYASVKIDGLPIRALAENTARQVYRLKEGQKIKVIRKGEGSPVFTGDSPLEGDWLEVMADDGSKGWCFSYNLTLFDERDSTSAVVSTSLSGPDSALENLLSRSWYPDLYRTMMVDNRIDIQRINPSWGFFPGKDAGVARIDSAAGVVTFPFSGIVKSDDGSYRFEGSTLAVQVRSTTSIIVQYTDANGMPQALYFSSLETTPDALIEAEKARRAELLAKIRQTGPRFSSGNYGVIQLLPNGRFLWSGYQLLSPSIIPSGAGSGGVIELRCFLSDTLLSSYTGVLSLQFDSTSQWLHFLYTLTPKGLKLEAVSETKIKDSVVLSSNLTPTVVFFTPDNSAQGGQ